MNKLCSFILVVFLMSCDSPKSGILHPEARYIADTMFSKRKALFIEELDSICLQKRNEWVITARDSILDIEKKRITELIREQ